MIVGEWSEANWVDARRVRLPETEQVGQSSSETREGSGQRQAGSGGQAVGGSRALDEERTISPSVTDLTWGLKTVADEGSDYRCC